MRHSQQGGHSVERLFGDIRAQLPSTIRVKLVVSQYPSNGLFKRIYNICEAGLLQGEVNHVTGDCHFLTYLLNRKRTILTILDCVMMERLRGIPRFLFWLFWLWLPSRRCSVISVISESTRHQVLKYTKCDPTKIKVIYCHVSDEFKPVGNVFNKDRPRILQVGTTVNKNIERIAHALADVRCKLIIVGPLSASQLNSLTANKIDFENLNNLARDALVAQYVACDLLMFASTYEGFGLPIVEANAVGRPVVTSNVWSMPEVAGNAACLVDPLDLGAIRAGVMRIIDDDDYRDALVTNGFENVKRFQLKKIAGQYAELYQQVYSHSK
jgi:glycosyltransferase involved in cell wall biosynthesis